MSEATTSIELERLVSSLIDLKGRTGSITPATLGASASARLALRGLADSAGDLGAAFLKPALVRLAQLTEVWECLAVETPTATGEIANFIICSFDRIIDAIRAGGGDPRPAGAIVEESTILWGDYLELIGPEEFEPNSKNTTTESYRNADSYALTDRSSPRDGGLLEDDYSFDPAEDDAASPSIDVASLLQMLTGNRSAAKPAHVERSTRVGEAASGSVSSAGFAASKPASSASAETNAAGSASGGDRFDRKEKIPSNESISVQAHDLICERAEGLIAASGTAERSSEATARPIPMVVEFAEIREAFLADSADIIDRVEPLMAALGEGIEFAENLAELKRCLHTLKGAAGSVGLVDLGEIVHAVEDRLDGEAIPYGSRRAVVDLLRGVLEYFEETLRDIDRGEIPRPPAEALRGAVQSPLACENSILQTNLNLMNIATVVEIDHGCDGGKNTACSGGSERASLVFDCESFDQAAENGASDRADECLGGETDLGADGEDMAGSRLGVEGGRESGEALRRSGFTSVREGAVRPTAGESEGLIRVSGERIDELMDMASELLSRRGAWMGRVETLKSFAAAAVQCRYRLTADVERLRDLTSDGRGRRLFGTDRERRIAPRRGGEYGDLIRRLAEQTEDLAVLAGSARSAAESLADDGDSLARLSLQLWNAVQAIRLVPARSLFQRLARVASEAARVEGRTIEVATVGDDLGVDRYLQDKAYEPLLHLTRNAVGHGIEPAADRLRAGKAAAGRVTFEVRNESNTVVFKIHDDGRGLDYGAIEAKARRLGLLGGGAGVSDERLSQMIFESGFSTREHSNAISGRGVGMDVVAKEVGRLNGTIALASIAGKGTTFTIRLPARIALEQAMLVRVGGVLIALPLESIELIDELDASKVQFEGVTGKGMIRGESTTILDARGALRLAAPSTRTCPRILLVRGEGERIAVLVDAIEGPRELVVKPLSALLAGHPAIVGTSFSAAGEIVFLLDPFGLARVSDRTVGAVADGTGVKAANATKRGLKANSVLVVDDSLSVRRVAARRLRELGFQVDEASDGLEAVKTLRENEYKLILTDLEMPRMDGFALLGELERVGVSSSTPVVVASTRSDQATRERVMARGATAFVAKPIDARAWENVLIPLLGTPVDERSTTNLDVGRISELI